MFALQGYFDESSDAKQRRVFGLAGIVAEAKGWEYFWREWEALLAFHCISEFHAADLDARQGIYAGFTEGRRDAIQSDFVDLLCRTKPEHFMGHSSVVLMQPYKEFLPRMMAQRKLPLGLPISGNIGHAYYLCLEHTVLEIAISTGIKNYPPDERLSFVADRNKELGGRAVGLFNILKDSTDVEEYRGRLGRWVYGDRKEDIPLQAADLLAYEYVRNARDTVLDGNPEREQFAALRERFGGGWVFDREHIEFLVKDLETKV